MDRIFGVPIDELDAEALRGFLDQAGDEPLTWELKGDEKNGRWIRRDQVLRAVCGFANSDRGGVLIVGGHKRRDRAGWELPGLAPPAAEPAPLLEQWIREGLIRPPRTQVRAWQVEGRVIAVVAVWPTPDPPCVTGDGQVFVRTAGETAAVRDPVALARLVDHGRSAWDRATARVASSAARILDIGDPGGRQGDVKWHPTVFALSVTATGLPHDIEFRAFSEGATTAVRAAASELPGDMMDAAVPYFHVDQDTYGWGIMRFHRTWLVAVTRDGTAAGSFGWESLEGSIQSLGTPSGPLSHLWSTSIDLLINQLGGTGRGRLRVLVDGSLPRFGQGKQFHVDRAVDLRHPDEAEVESVVREIRRACGDGTALEIDAGPL